jgi:hypothetical protein
MRRRNVYLIHQWELQILSLSHLRLAQRSSIWNALPPYFLPPEGRDSLPACVHLLLLVLVNGGWRLLSGTQITAARTGQVSPFPLLSVLLPC